MRLGNAPVATDLVAQVEALGNTVVRLGLVAGSELGDA